MAKRNRTCASFFILVVLALLASGCSPAKTAAAGDSAARIDNFIAGQMRAQHIPGLAIGIVKGQDTIYLKGFGKAGPAGGAVTPDTPFLLASVSKSITALAVLELADSGLVALDAPAVKYIPWFKTADEGASASITVRQLLNQTSGLSTYVGNALNHGNGAKPLDDLVRMLAVAALASKPGSAFHYSNANYILLADIVEHVSGQAYGSYVESHVFRPLGMGNSAVEPPQALQSRMAAGYRYWFGFPAPMQAYRYLGCLNNVSTARDMTNYLTALMNGGTFQGVSVSTPGALKLMRTPAVQMRPGVSYAMGLEVDSTKPFALIRHPGDAPGYNANIAIMPQGDFGIVVLENANWLGMEGETGSIIAGIEQILSGSEPSPQPFNPGNLMYGFDGIYIVTFVFLALGFLRLSRWKRKLIDDGKDRLRRRLIPVVINNFMVPACMVVFIPMFFSADWSQGFLNGPDFTLSMLTIAALLAILGLLKAIIVFKHMAARKAAPTNPTVR